MFVSQPVDGVIYVARRRERGGKLLIWTAVPVEPGPEVRLGLGAECSPGFIRVAEPSTWNNDVLDEADH